MRELIIKTIKDMVGDSPARVHASEHLESASDKHLLFTLLSAHANINFTYILKDIPKSKVIGELKNKFNDKSIDGFSGLLSI